MQTSKWPPLTNPFVCRHFLRRPLKIKTWSQLPDLGFFHRCCASNMPDFTGYSSQNGLNPTLSVLILLVSVLVSVFRAFLLSNQGQRRIFTRTARTDDKASSGGRWVGLVWGQISQGLWVFGSVSVGGVGFLFSTKQFHGLK